MRNAFSAAGLAVALLASAALNLEARTWTQTATGRKLEADFVGVSGENAKLRISNGTTFEVPIASLSIEDQTFIKENSEVAVKVTWTGADWPRFRGEDFSNISPDENLMKEWPEEGPKKMWTFGDAGLGYSGMAFQGGILYTLGTQANDRVHLMALDAITGKEIFRYNMALDVEAAYEAGWGRGPRSTPTCSGDTIYALTAGGDIHAVRASDGTMIWEVHMNNLGGRPGNWGYAESPLIDNGRLIVGPGYLTGMAAVDAASGKEAWRSMFDAGLAEYASVVPAEINGVRQYIKLFMNELVSVNAQDGTVLWRSPWPEGATAVIPTPIVEGNQIYITSGYGAGSKLVEIGSDNTPKDVWQNKEMKNHHGGVVKVGDHVYGFSDGAGLICQSWKTGEMVWNEKTPELTKGSVTAADGMLYCLNEDDGTVTLVEASPDGFSAHGSFRMEPQSARRHEKGKIWTHPVVIGGNLYLRDQDQISCYRVQKPDEAPES